MSATALWRARLGRCLTTREMARQLDLSEAEVEQLAGLRCLLRVGEDSYPVFQLQRGQLVPGLADVLVAFDADTSPLLIASWLVEPQPLLDGETPIGWLRRGGEIERAVEAARRAAAPLAR